MALHVRCSSPHDSDFKQWGQRSHCLGRPWNLSWTSSLGQAFTNQQSDVMAAVQLDALQGASREHAAVLTPDQGGATEPTNHRDRTSE